VFLPGGGMTPRGGEYGARPRSQYMTILINAYIPQSDTADSAPRCDFLG
jgi:hypothetical protein